MTEVDVVVLVVSSGACVVGGFDVVVTEGEGGCLSGVKFSVEGDGLLGAFFYSEGVGKEGKMSKVSGHQV